jgi:hypothetical protein
VLLSPKKENVRAIMLDRVLFVFFVLCWTTFMISQVMMIMNRKPGVKLFDPDFFGNPLTVQFYGSKYLTARGLLWRRISWLSGIGLVIGLLWISLQIQVAKAT